MLEVLLTIVAIVILLGLVMLLWPLRVRVQVWPGRAQVDVRYIVVHLTLDFLSGDTAVRIAGVRVASGGPSIDKAPRRPKPPKPEAERPWWRDRIRSMQDAGPSRARVLWEHFPLLRRLVLQLVKLIGRLIRSWTLDEARLALVLGLGNPAQTGIAAGCIYGALPTLQMSLPRWQIGFTPEFQRAYAAIDADITLRLLPIKPVYQIVRTLGTLPWRRLWKLRAALGQS